MHTLLHEHLAKASTRVDPQPRAVPAPAAPHAPPGRLRVAAARALVAAAARVDRESARRALA